MGTENRRHVPAVGASGTLLCGKLAQLDQSPVPGVKSEHYKAMCTQVLDAADARTGQPRAKHPG